MGPSNTMESKKKKIFTVVRVTGEMKYVNCSECL